jgi:hypothetical protein
VETAGKGNLQTKTYKQELQVQKSSQTLVDWRLGECGNKFIDVCTEANSVKGAEAADFFLYCWYLKVLSDDGI